MILDVIECFTYSKEDYDFLSREFKRNLFEMEKTKTAAHCIEIPLNKIAVCHTGEYLYIKE